jgi:hypothetical protein
MHANRRARLSELEPPAGPDEESNADLGLKAADLLGDRGLGDESAPAAAVDEP